MFFSVTDEDECSLGTHSCANSGTCVNTAGSYTCDCTGTGYSGSDCSTGKRLISGIYASLVFLLQTSTFPCFFSMNTAMLSLYLQSCICFFIAEDTTTPHSCYMQIS